MEALKGRGVDTGKVGELENLDDAAEEALGDMSDESGTEASGNSSAQSGDGER